MYYTTRLLWIEMRGSTTYVSSISWSVGFALWSWTERKHSTIDKIERVMIGSGRQDSTVYLPAVLPDLFRLVRLRKCQDGTREMFTPTFYTNFVIKVDSDCEFLPGVPTKATGDCRNQLLYTLFGNNGFCFVIRSCIDIGYNFSKYINFNITNYIQWFLYLFKKL